MSVRHQKIITLKGFFLSEKNSKILYQAYSCSENSGSSIVICFLYPANVQFCCLRQGKGETVVINKLAATSSKPVLAQKSIKNALSCI